MIRVFLSIGSNVERDKNIESCLSRLQQQFGSLLLSSVYESEAVGFDGHNFYNMVAAIKTDMPLKSLSSWLKLVEDEHGRDRRGPKFGPRTLDIDIICYDGKVGTFDEIELPRPELYYNAFVLLPMAEIASAEIDVKTGTSYHQLWQEAHLQQEIWPVNFTFAGQQISTENAPSFNENVLK